MSSSAFLALDWGTTNLRAWVVGEGGEVLRHREFPLGIGRLQPGEAAQRFHEDVRPALQAEALPALLCGMVGSAMGWTAVPYLDCPADVATLKNALRRVESEGPPVWIVPGLRAQRPDGGPDVMRSEETQLFGWAADHPDRRQGEQLVCLPGTHAKWVRMIDGRVESFVTSMTGELFDVLHRHTVLQVRDAEDDPAAFELGLTQAGDGGALASRMFTARSRVVGGDMRPEQVKSYLSGLLIGAEAASVPALFGVKDGSKVSIIGNPTLSAGYAKALRRRGFEPEVFDGDGASLAGLKALMA